MEQLLITRIKKFLSTNGKQDCNISYVARKLRELHPEYKRKKMDVFQLDVANVWSACKSGLKTTTTHDKRNGSDERRFPSDTERYVTYEDDNSVNNAISDLYSRSREPSPRSDSHLSSGIATPPAKRSRRNKEKSLHASYLIDKIGDPSLYSPNASVIDSASSSCRVSPNPYNTGSAPSSRASPHPQITRSASASPTDQLPPGSPAIIDLTEVERKLDPHVKKSDTKKKLRKARDRPVTKSVPEVQKSETRFKDIGGYEDVIRNLLAVLKPLHYPKLTLQAGGALLRGLLIYGPSGCGKTLLAEAIAGELGFSFLRIVATEIVSGVSGESEEKLRDLFEKAKECAPCVLFLDEIDAVTQKRETASKEMERRIVSQLGSCIDDLQSGAYNHVLVIGATNCLDTIDSSLRRPGRFDKEVCMGIPDEQARSRILKVCCQDCTVSEDVDMSVLAQQTPGWFGADLKALVAQAVSCAVHRTIQDIETEYEAKSKERDSSAAEANDTQSVLCDNSVGQAEEQTQDDTPVNLVPAVTQDTALSHSQSLQQEIQRFQNPVQITDDMPIVRVTQADFSVAMGQIQPSALREGFATVPGVTWDDVGALAEVREELRIKLLEPVSKPEMFKKFGLNNPKGVLLAGPPGCGKTLVAKALANECAINFISVKGPELINKYVGESERSVRQVFERARTSAPCVLFFDELDSLCPTRRGTSDNGSSRVVNQMLTEMDGLEQRKQVFVLGATNRPDIIDPAVLRPGRLSTKLYVGLPNADDRAAILRTITKNGTVPPLHHTVDLTVISSDAFTDRFSGADLAHLVNTAAEVAIKKILATCQDNTHVEERTERYVTMQDFNIALTKVQPSVSEEDQAKYERMRRKLMSSAS